MERETIEVSVDGDGLTTATFTNEIVSETDRLKTLSHVKIDSWKERIEKLCETFSGLKLVSERRNIDVYHSGECMQSTTEARFVLRVESQFAPRRYLFFGPRTFDVEILCGVADPPFQSRISDRKDGWYGMDKYEAWFGCHHEAHLVRIVLATVKCEISLLMRGCAGSKRVFTSRPTIAANWP
jgi:hypothetical protein